MLVVVLMFYLFLRQYLVKPVLRINNALGDYLRYRIPLDENIACRDEIQTLRERIASLISKLR